MNWGALKERQDNERYIRRYNDDGMKVLVVDGDATFHGYKVRNLTSTYRRKFENVLVLSETSKERVPVKVVYR